MHHTTAEEVHRGLTKGVQPHLREAVRQHRPDPIRALHPAGVATPIQLRREAALRAAVLLPIPRPAEAPHPHPVLSGAVVAVADAVPPVEVVDDQAVAADNKMK